MGVGVIGKISSSVIKSYDIYDDIKDQHEIAAIEDNGNDDRKFIEDLKNQYPGYSFTGIELHLSHFYFIRSKKIVSFISKMI